MSRPSGENALNRAVRLLKELTESLVKHDNETLELRLSPDGSGSLVHLTDVPQGTATEPVFEFESTAELTQFLEADTLSQILRSRRSAR